MGISINRAAVGTYRDISGKSRKYNYYDSIQSNLLEKLDQIQKKDLFFILSVNSFGMFVILYFLLYLF
ncbi:MAG: hypothetical protein IH852_04230 [Bacteroidetes bacterium]|nr:hypothetical protein [Bacteroidota bacterium]